MKFNVTNYINLKNQIKILDIQIKNKCINSFNDEESEKLVNKIIKLIIQKNYLFKIYLSEKEKLNSLKSDDKLILHYFYNKKLNPSQISKSLKMSYYKIEKCLSKYREKNINHDL